MRENLLTHSTQSKPATQSKIQAALNKKGLLETSGKHTK